MKKIFYSVIFLISISLITIPLLSDDTDAAPSSDVHGISYLEGSSFKFAVFPTSGYAYPVVDWYIYHVGTVEIITDGEISGIFTSSGFMVYTQRYDLGTSHTVKFRMDGSEVDFSFSVRQTLSLRDFNGGDPVEMISLSANDYILQLLALALVVGVSTFFAVFMNYLHRRNSNRRGMRSV